MIRHIKIKKLYNHELFFILFYILLAFTAITADNTTIALRLVVYEIILVITFLLLRSLSKYITINNFINSLTKIGKYYVILSFLYYLLGLYYANTISGTGEEVYIYGLMKENILFRFRGFAESPNNYILWGSLFLYLFMYTKNTKFIFISIINLLATVSTTAFVGLSVSVIIYFIIQKKFLKLFLFIISSLGLAYGFYLYFIASSDSALKAIQWRIERNSSGTGRFELWEYVLSTKIPEHPFFGYGINQTREIIASFHHLNSLHNAFLEALLTSGIIGLSVYLLFVFSLFISTLKLTKAYNTDLFLNLFIMFFIVSMANNTLHMAYLIVYLLILYIFIKNIRLLKS